MENANCSVNSESSYHLMLNIMQRNFYEMQKEKLEIYILPIKMVISQ